LIMQNGGELGFAAVLEFSLWTGGV
jgi:hypothetical protein